MLLDVDGDADRWPAAGLAAILATRPALASSFACRRVGAEVVGWADGGTFTLNPVASALVAHLDGRAPLGELADDLAAVLGIDLDGAERAVAVLAHDLYVRGALREDDDLAVLIETAERADEPATRVDDSVVVRSWVDRSTDAPTLVEELADGSTRYTASLDVGADGAVDPGADRSLVEVVPAGSCLGSKLRLDDVPDVVVVRTALGHATIWSHADAVTDALVTLAGDRMTTGVTAPVRAVVVAPYEGTGPCRVFDGLAARRGRPRTAEAAAAVALAVVDEHDVLTVPAEASVPVEAMVMLRGDDVLLVHRSIATIPRFAAESGRRGWQLSAVQTSIDPDGRLTTGPVDLRTADRLDHRWPTGLAMPGMGEPSSPARATVQLLAHLDRSARADRTRALDAVAALVEVVPMLTIDISRSTDAASLADQLDRWLPGTVAPDR